MPKQTFFNLPPEKRERIVSAIRQEFTEHLYADVSINRIIKDAGIPRGSFYQYFEDKHDLLDFLIGDYIQWVVELFKATAQSCGGDLFTFCDRIVDQMWETSHSYSSRQLFKQLMSDPAVVSELIRNFNSIIQSVGCPEDSPLPEVIDREKLRVDSEKEFFLLLSSMMDLLKNAVFAFILLEEPSFDHIKSLHHDKISFMRKQFQKAE